MKKTLIALLTASLALPLIACGKKDEAPKPAPQASQAEQAPAVMPTLSKEERELLDIKVMNDTYKFDTTKQCWRTDGACLKMRFDHSVMTEQGENIYVRASGPVKTQYSEATLHSLIVYQPTPDGYKIIDSKKVRTFTYGMDGDGAKYPYNRFLQFGTNSYGWMLIGLEHESDGPAQFGTFYALDNGHLKSLGSVSVILDDGESRLKCAVDVDKKSGTNSGYFPLNINVTGTANGTSIKKTISIPFSLNQQQYVAPDTYICGN